MKYTPKNYSDEIRLNQILHMALVMGVLMFTVVTLTLWYMQWLELNPFLDRTTAMAVCALAGGVLFFVSRMLFNKKMAGSGSKPLAKKLSDYRTAHIVRCALVEASAFIALVLFMLHGYPELLVFPGLAILYMLTLFPSRQKMVREMKPAHDELQYLEKPRDVF